MHILKVKNLRSIIDRDPIIVDEGIFIGDAIALMAKSGKGILVTNNNQLLGYLTEKDIVKIIASGWDLNKTKVSQVSNNSFKRIKEGELTVNSLISMIQENSLSLILVVNDNNQMMGTIYATTILESLECAGMNVELYVDNPQGIINQEREEIEGNLIIGETNRVSIFDQKIIHENMTACQREVPEIEDIQRIFQGILDNSPGIIYVVDTENKYLLVNQEFTKLTNVDQSEVIGKNIYDIWPRDTAEIFAQSNLEVVRSGICITQEKVIPLVDGLHTYLSMKFPLVNAEGNVYAICGISTDITDRKKTETELVLSQERLQYLLSSSPAIIYCRLIENTDYTNKYITNFMSENVQDMLGYAAYEYLAIPNFWVNHIHPDDVDFVLLRICELLAQGGEYSLEYRFLHQDGYYRWVYDQGKIITHRDRNDQSLQIVGYWADVTNRKKLEQDLIIALEKEKELNELKSRFISTTSHEFCTPLSTILSSTELLEHYGHKWSREKQLTHLHRIQTAVQRMTEMLNDVLTIGKVEANKLEYNHKSLDLVHYCRHLLEEFKLHRINQINQTTLMFSSTYQSISCSMDQKLLHHIISNLLANAIKYSHHGGIVKLSLSCEAQKAILTVEDQGIGIPQEDIPRLFDSFHRGSNVDNIVGSGLGLAIVKKCVEIHKGEIFVQSQVNIGTRFTVILPLYS